jgi:hypothetical protein
MPPVPFDVEVLWHWNGLEPEYERLHVQKPLGYVVLRRYRYRAAAVLKRFQQRGHLLRRVGLILTARRASLYATDVAGVLAAYLLRDKDAFWA